MERQIIKANSFCFQDIYIKSVTIFKNAHIFDDYLDTTSRCRNPFNWRFICEECKYCSSALRFVVLNTTLPKYEKERIALLWLSFPSRSETGSQTFRTNCFFKFYKNLSCCTGNFCKKRPGVGVTLLGNLHSLWTLGWALEDIPHWTSQHLEMNLQVKYFFYRPFIFKNQQIER